VLERIDCPSYRYDGIDDQFYLPFVVAVDNEEFEIVPSELRTLEGITDFIPDISARQVCELIDGKKRKLDVLKLTKSLIANRTNRPIEDVQEVTEIDVFLGNIYERPLFFYVGGKEKNIILLFTQGELQPARYVRALEGVIKVVHL
jgi:hypothetical protein